MRMFWWRLFSKTSLLHKDTTTDIELPEDEWEEREKRDAFRREIATLKSMNRELKDFTGQIPGGFASIRVERPLLSVHCYL